MPRCFRRRCYSLAAVIAGALLSGGARSEQETQPAGLLLAFASYRVHPGFPRLYYYRHDGLAQGKVTQGPPTPTDRSDFDPHLTPDGRLLAFNYEVTGKVARAMLWDVAGARALPLPEPPPAAIDMGPSVSADGKRLVVSTLYRPGPSGWNLAVSDADGKPLDLPGLNSDDDDRMPSLSADGRRLAFASSRPGGAGLQDLFLYDLQERRLTPLPGLNSPSRETEPSLSADGRWLAFVSTRPQRAGAPAGSGNLDVYLYDTTAKALVALPGLNGPGPDQSPALSPDGRFIAFVSERISGEGGRDVYLYDRKAARLVSTPGLNSPRDDADPALAYLLPDE